MSVEHLAQQFAAYSGWKKDLLREITRYRDWLNTNRINSDSVNARLERAQQRLLTDHIDLAFVGEFSRGKTELINSLFFASFGKRMLPSQAGRTTMCPTELFHDADAESAYIRLLPIETRLSEDSLSQFKRERRFWHELKVDANDPQGMIDAFAEVASSKVMTGDEAIRLGFQPDLLDPADEPGMVYVPAWRHALINFDHPLLRQGLRVIDTPGLNALGSEPELTLSMLPAAQAIIFLLAADTGVTASDMAIWDQHVRQLNDSGPSRLFAVLNKADVLWDDLTSETETQMAVERIRRDTARQLGIEVANVLPLSAKRALVAKATGDAALLARSRLPELEALLSERIVEQKEQLLEDQVVRQVISLLQNSQRLLQLRLQAVDEQQRLLEGQQQDNSTVLEALTQRTRDEHNAHHRRLLDLRSHQRLLSRQSEPLRAITDPARLQQHLDRLRGDLESSWTTVGIGQAIQTFFDTVDNDLHHLAVEAEQANRLVTAIYQRHNTENPEQRAGAPKFTFRRYQRELEQLRGKSDSFRHQFKNFFTEQRLLIRRFFTTLVQEVIELFRQLRQKVDQWADNTLTPLMQTTLEHKQLLESHLIRLRAATQESRVSTQRGEALEHYRAQVQGQLAEAEDMLRTFRRPATPLYTDNVIPLHGASQLAAQKEGTNDQGKG